MWTILIILVVIFLIWQYKDYKSCLVSVQKYKNDLIKEGKELKKNAEAKMKKIKCKKGGKCNFILEDTTKMHLEGWYDEITGCYKCTKCKNVRNEMIQYPS